MGLFLCAKIQIISKWQHVNKKTKPKAPLKNEGRLLCRFLICYQLLRLVGVRASADFALNTTDGYRE